MSEVEFQPDFQSYLNAIRNEYGRWWEYYTVTDAQGRERRKVPEPKGQREASPFDFGLMVQTVTRDNTRRTQNRDNPKEIPKEPPEKIERLPVLDGLRKYAFDEKTRQLLLVGRPGSGKSTALARLLLEEADRFSGGTSNTIPVLVELRYWRTSINDLILDAFRRHGLELNAAELDRLLNENRLLVLMDGMNELPTEEGRSQLAAFRRKYSRVPAIFTTRDLSLGGDAGIEKKLEMQPLTELQMQAFVEAYLPERGEAMWRQLQGRLREFGQTPLLLWMLCEVVKQSPNTQLSTDLAGIFQVFTRTYEDSSVRKHAVAVLKRDVTPLSDRRLWRQALKHLSWVMMHKQKLIPLLVIRRSTAERELEKLFKKEPYSSKTARDCLDDLLNYHLLQIRTGDEIEFRHQLIQEYYAAEALRERLLDVSDRELKRDYLNYLKWTEPVALMLALVEDEALRVVRLALEVDWMLGARLAGEVKPEFQEQTVEMVNGLDVPQWLKVKLWEKTRSDFAVPGLVEAFEYGNSDVQRSAVEVLGTLGSEAAIPVLLAILEDEDYWVREKAAKALGNLGSEAAIPGLLATLEHKYSWVRGNAVEALGNLGSEAVIPDLLATLEDEGYWVRRNAAKALGKLGSEAAIPGLLAALKDDDFGVRRNAAEALGNLDSEATIPGLLAILEHKDFGVRRNAAEVLGKLGSEAAIPDLLATLEDEEYWVREKAAEALGNLGSEAAIPGLLVTLEDDDFEDFGVHMNAVEVSGNLNSEAAIPDLLAALEDGDSNAWRRAAHALENFKDDRAAHILPHLLTLISTHSGKDAFLALTAIQANCKFYNYDIFSSPPIRKPETENPNRLLDRIDKNTQQIDKRTQKMADQPKNNFSGATFSGPVNFGDHPTGDFIGTQKNYTFPDPKQAEATQKIVDLLQDIRNKNPQATDAEIINIVDRGLANMQQNNPQKWRKWIDVLSVVFAGGVEAVKLVAPALGIPIEIGKRLYEIFDRHRKQLPLDDS